MRQGGSEGRESYCLLRGDCARLCACVCGARLGSLVEAAPAASQEHPCMAAYRTT